MALRVVSNRPRGKARMLCKSPALCFSGGTDDPNKIRKKNEEIKGILKDSSIKDDLKLLPNADDMTLLLKHKRDLRRALVEIDTFSKNIGAQTKQEKIPRYVGGQPQKQAGWE